MFLLKPSFYVESVAPIFNITKPSKKRDVDRKGVKTCVPELDSGKLIKLPPATKRASGGWRKLGDTEVDQELLEWFSKRRSYGARITGKVLLKEAQHSFFIAGVTTFKASRGWLQNWMQRHSESTREKTTVEHIMPDHVEDNLNVMRQSACLVF